MIRVKKEGIILCPTKNRFEKKSVLNPAIYQDGDDVHMIYRAIDNNFVSCLGYAKFSGPKKLVQRWKKPFLYPRFNNEKQGIEDPRIVKLNDIFYLTYVIHDGKNAITSYSLGKNIFNLKRGGIISPKIMYREAGKIFSYSKLKDDYYFFESFYQKYGGKNVLIWHKDVFLFPEKINNRYILIHRILPDVQILQFDDFNQLKDKYFWVMYLSNLSKNVIIEGKHGFESRHVGGGAPPIKTKHGWLMIYHGSEESNNRKLYHAGAILTDLKNPKKIIGRLPYPLFSPTEDYEIKGMVNNVVFPTGTAIFKNRLYIYYGAADTYIALASVNIDNLIKELLKYKNK